LLALLAHISIERGSFNGIWFFEIHWRARAFLIAERSRRFLRLLLLFADLIEDELATSALTLSIHVFSIIVDSVMRNSMR